MTPSGICAYCGRGRVEVWCPNCGKWFCGDHRQDGVGENCYRLVIRQVREAKARVKLGQYGAN